MAVPIPSPSNNKARVPEGVRFALAAGLAAAVVLVGLVLFVGRSGSDDETEAAAAHGLESSAEPGAGDSGQPEPTDEELEGSGSQGSGSQGSGSGDLEDGADESSQGVSICPDGTLPEVCSAVAFIEEFKGDRPFKRFPTVNFVDEDAFDEFLLEDFDGNVEELRDTGDVLRSLGLIEPDVDLADALRTLLELGVVGAYNTETEELNINGTEVNLYTRSVMVHELTHAWDDQYYELRRPEYDDATDESASGFLSVVEGSAVLTEQAWRATLSEGERAELERLELGAISPEDLDLLFTVPMFVLQLQISPYTDGAAFVEAIYAEEGLDGLDVLFDDPPTTSEQVLDVEAYRTREAAVPVVTPEPGGEVIDEGVLGRLTFDLWFGPDIGAGWGGDAYVAWRDGETICTGFAVTGDDRVEIDEYLGALETWASEAPAGSTRSIELVDSGTDLPQIEAVACI